MLNENKRIRAKIQPTFEQLAMLHVAKVFSLMHAFTGTHINKRDRELCTIKWFHIDWSSCLCWIRISFLF